MKPNMEFSESAYLKPNYMFNTTVVYTISKVSRGDGQMPLSLNAPVLIQYGVNYRKC